MDLSTTSCITCVHKGTEIECKLQHLPHKYKRNRGIRTVTILDVQWKKSRSSFALVLNLKAESLICSSAFMLFGPYVLSGVKLKRKKKKKRKKIQSSPRDLSPLRLYVSSIGWNEEKGLFYWMMMRESVLSEWRGWWFRKKEKQWSSAGCVQGRVFWFCCFFVCNSLLLSQSPSVPLLQCSSFMRPPGWQSALLIGYLCREGTTWQPLQCARLPLSPSGEITESPPPLPSLPFHLSTPSFSLPFLSSCPPLHTHTRRAVWIGLHLHFQNRWVQKKTVDLSLSFPTLCTHFGLSTAPSFLS